MGNPQSLRSVLFHEEHRGALLVDLLNDAEDLVDEHRRQSHRRLVEKKQAGTTHEGTGDGEHLLLAAGHRSTGLIDAFAQAREQREHALQILRRRGRFAVGPEVHAHLEVLANAHAGKDPASFGRLTDAHGNSLV